MKKRFFLGIIMFIFLTGCTNYSNQAFIENSSQDVNLLYNSEDGEQIVGAIKIDTSSDGDNSEALDISLSADPKANADALRFSDDLKPGSFEESDLKISIEGIEITLGDNFLNKYEKLGKPRIEKSKACLEDGYDIDYFYNNDKLVVYTMVNDSKQLIFNIEITDGKYLTTKGAKVGESTKDDIYEMYGMPTDHSGKIFRYVLSEKKCSLEFAFNSEGILESIDYVDTSVS